MKKALFLIMGFMLLGGLLWQCGGSDNPRPGPGPSPGPYPNGVLLATATIEISTGAETNQSQADRVQGAWSDPMLYCAEKTDSDACVRGGCQWIEALTECVPPEWFISVTLASSFSYSVTWKKGIPSPIQLAPQKLGSIDPVSLQDNRTVLLNFDEVGIWATSPDSGLVGSQTPEMKIPLYMRNCTKAPQPDPNQPLDPEGVALVSWVGDPNVDPIPPTTDTCELWADFTSAWAQTYSGKVVIDYWGDPKACATDDDCWTPYICKNNVCTYDPNAPTNRIVFVTKTFWDGDLGGLAGADAKCNKAWKDANPAITKNFVALLSGGSTKDGKFVNVKSATSRLTDPPAGTSWVLWDKKDPITGTPVAASKAQLQEYGPQVPINVTEEGVKLADGDNPNVWTGSRTDMILDQAEWQCTPALKDGSTWTGSGVVPEWRGTSGLMSKKDAKWIHNDAFTCGLYKNRLYCFESPPAP